MFDQAVSVFHKAKALVETLDGIWDDEEAREKTGWLIEMEDMDAGDYVDLWEDTFDEVGERYYQFWGESGWEFKSLDERNA